jgi:glycosyltransferase involved in cell wall biosynthesis
MPKVTFIMPTIRNRFINRAILSIMEQTLIDWELIIFNNLIGRQLKFDDKRIRIIDTDNMPLVECLNIGTEMAKSNIIMHHCDDDISYPERAEITYNRITEGSDLFVGGYIAVNENNKIKYAFYPPPSVNLEHIVTRGNNIPLFVAGYRKDKAPKYRLEFPILHDHVFLLELLSKGFNYIATSTPLAMKIHHKEAFNINKESSKEKETIRMRRLFQNDTIRSDRELVYL